MYKFDQNYKKSNRLSVSLIALMLASFSVGGCDLTRNHTKIDREKYLEVQDYRDALAPRHEEDVFSADEYAAIPEMTPYIVEPSDQLKPMPLVSISINQSVPLKDALYELAQQADYDVEIDPRIKGSIIFRARDRAFDDVVERICKIAGLRYKFQDDVVRIEVDTPYHETYKIDYLSYIRTNKGSISNDVGVVSGGSTNTGSRFEATTSSEADFWGELETNLTQILGLRNAPSELMTENDPTISAAPSNPAPVEPVVTQNEQGETVVQVQAPDVQLNVQSLPTDTSPGSNDDDDERFGVSSFSLNKQAGIISSYATERQHKQIREYMDKLRRSVTSQVLIEAKILEVSLSDEFATGIDWSTLANLSSEWSIGFTGSGGSPRPSFDTGISPGTELTLSYTGSDISGVIEAVSRFGTVSALASPRMTVLNNQSAVLNVTTNEVYFEIDVQTTSNDSATTITVDSDIRNVPEGVIINVQPSIDLDNQMVSMAVRPTITKIVDFIQDPAVSIQAPGVASLVPVLNVQEMDSVVRLGSGQAIVMGGLMQDNADSQQQGVPVLSEIPIMGTLFRNQVDEVSKTELVVFLRATIVEDSNVHQTDKDLYKMFASDRRPLRL